MTARAQHLLQQLRELPLAERTELEQQLHEQNERELIEWIAAEVKSGRMPTISREESAARVQSRIAEVRRAQGKSN